MHQGEDDEKVGLSIINCLGTLSLLASPTWTMGPYTGASFEPSKNNLISGVMPTSENGLGGGDENTNSSIVLTDGVVATEATSAQYGLLCKVSNRAVVEYSFPDGSSSIEDIRIYSMWRDTGRDRISLLSIEVKEEGSTVWEQIPNSAVSFDQNTLLNRVILSDPEGVPLAVGITDIRFNFADQENGWCGYSEIEVNGVAASFSAEDPRVVVSVSQVAPRKAILSAGVTDCGEGSSLVDLYFGYGVDPNNLSMMCITNGVGVDVSVPIVVSGLLLNTQYYYRFYGVNDQGRTSTVKGGAFTTLDGSAPRWTGLVSTRWSDALNWDSEVAPTEGSTINTLVLEVAEGAYQPLDLDVPGLTIRNLYFGRYAASDMVVSGLPFSLTNLRHEDKLNPRTLSISNAVTFVGQCNNGTESNFATRFCGPVTGTQGLYSGGNGNVYFLHENPDFQGQIYMNVGGFGFYGEENLGIPPSEPTPQYLGQGWGSINLLSPIDRDLKVAHIHPNRGLYGSFTLGHGTELWYAGEVGSNNGNGEFNFIGPDENEYRHVHLAGTATPNVGKLRLDRHVLVFAESPTAFGDGTRMLDVYHGGVWDFNGYSSPAGITHYSEGAYNPNFINNDIDSPVILSGDIRFALDQGTPMFGGLGDITHTGNSDYRRDAAYEGRFRKKGPGTLTLAGDTYIAYGSAYVDGGKLIFDYSAHNTHRTFSDSPYATDTHLIFKGNDEEHTSVMLNELRNNDTVIIETQPGAAGMTLDFGKINSLSDSRIVDFRFGPNTTVNLTNPDFDNHPVFGGIHPNVTWDHGRSWAYVTPDGSLGPLPASFFSSSLQMDTIWDVPAGATTVPQDTRVNAVRIAGTTGPTTLTLNGRLVVTDMGSSSASAILITPDVGGPVVIEGPSVLQTSAYNRNLTIHNHCTNYPTRISARLPYTNNNGLYFFGPGTTRLDNDRNGFFYGPYLFGGANVQFTSIGNSRASDQGWDDTLSSLGNDYYSREILIGHDSTFEYVGTNPAGHSSNRRFKIYGTSTLKANGKGPLHLTAENVVSSAYASTRLILDGDGVGVIEGSIRPGDCGWVEKRGSGTWTLRSNDSKYEYPTRALAGTLALEGDLPSSLEIAPGATVTCAEGITIKRHLMNEGTLTYVANSSAATHEPIVVRGEVSLQGEIEIKGTLREPTAILVAENGITGEIHSSIERYKMWIEGNEIIADPGLPTILLFR